MSTPKDTFVSIAPDNLEQVAGGVSRGSSDQLTTMLTSITSSIKDLASKNNQSDPTQLLLIMMMMGGFGGGGGAVIAGGGGYAGGAVAGPPVINLDTGIVAGGPGGWGVPGGFFGGGCRRGKKGW
jgi:hypothetical protein